MLCTRIRNKKRIKNEYTYEAVLLQEYALADSVSVPVTTVIIETKQAPFVTCITNAHEEGLFYLKNYNMFGCFICEEFFPSDLRDQS